MQKIIKPGSFFLCLFLMAACVLIQSCGTEDKKAPADKDKYVIPDSLMRTLSIDTVKTSQLMNAITLTGKIGFNEDNVIPVYSMVSGNIQDIKVLLGDYVHTGQVLAVVKSSEMAGFSNDLVNSESNLRLAETNLQKTKDMYKSGLASRTDSINAEVVVQQARFLNWPGSTGC